MGKENSDRSPIIYPFEVRHFRSKDPNKKHTYRAINITESFSSGAIKEILSQMVWGFNPGRLIAFTPNGSEDPETLTSEDLVDLRSFPREDRLAQLDIHSMRIKASSAKVIIEKSSP